MKYSKKDKINKKYYKLHVQYEGIILVQKKYKKDLNYKLNGNHKLIDQIKKLARDYEVIKSNYNRVLVHENEIIRSYIYKIKKLIREVKNQKLMIEQFKKKYQYENEMLNKGILTYQNTGRKINNRMKIVKESKIELKPLQLYRVKYK